MTVANPREVPEYELNPLEIQVRKADGISRVRACLLSIDNSCFEATSLIACFCKTFREG